MAPIERAAGSDWIPNINIGEDYDRRYVDALIHYDRLGRFADFFGRDMPVHRHAQCLQIHYIENGPIDFHIDNRQFRLDGPALFYTPAAVPHSFRTEPDAGGHVLTIHQSIAWQLMRRVLQEDVQIRLDHGLCVSPQAMDEGQTEQWRLLTDLLETAGIEWSAERPARRIAINNIVELVLLLIGRLGERPQEGTEVRSDELKLFHRFSAMLEQKYTEHWRLVRYASELAVSEARLNQVCRQVSGCSPKQLLTERLLQEAKRLLSVSERNASDIGYALGFNDPAYFSRFFKAQCGVTPSGFRQQRAQA